MLKIFSVIGAVVVAGIAVVLVVAAMRPDQFRVQRSAAIKVSPERIFPLIADFKAWAAWSPYENKDPAMKRTYGPSTSGKGASYAWDGDSNVGAGNMLITDAPSPSKVALDLNMTRPITAHNKVEFTLTPAGDSTTVTWAMRGEVPYFAKIIHVFFNMDKMVGGDFEAGLVKLKAAAEK
ncbi:MAG: SRPBCC family protein [Alphaproteobacteria bacterium]|nr:SRPBCC family protein [Alphaproteobacteria bacterium]